MKRSAWKIPFLCALLLCVLLLTGAGAREEPAGETPAPYTPVSVTVYEENRESFESFEGYLRIDSETTESWQGELSNLRLITEGEYALGEAAAKYDLDPDYEVSTEGLDTLNISGSAQFSEPQFRVLAEELRRVADGRQIVIVDLRGESHCLLNGIPVSWMGENNWGNFGLDMEAIEADEAERFGSLLGQTVTLSLLAGGPAADTDTLDITVGSVMSERELAESEGFGYFRTTSIDHSFPTPAEIESFIEFVKTLDMEDTWLHFHCGAGKGRTGIFMMLYDKMKNPGVSAKDIMYRHAKMGASYPIYTNSGFNGPMYAEKSALAPLLFQYVEENCADNYAVSWSEWLAGHIDEAA